VRSVEKISLAIVQSLSKFEKSQRLQPANDLQAHWHHAKNACEWPQKPQSIYPNKGKSVFG